MPKLLEILTFLDVHLYMSSTCFASLSVEKSQSTFFAVGGLLIYCFVSSLHAIPEKSNFTEKKIYRSSFSNTYFPETTSRNFSVKNSMNHTLLEGSFSKKYYQACSILTSKINFFNKIWISFIFQSISSFVFSKSNSLMQS